MIAMISGVLSEKGEGEALIMTSAGIGFSVNCSMNTISALPAVGEKCTVLTHFAVK